VDKTQTASSLCLQVGIKGNPVLNRNIDCDVLVAEVRETSRKPDEMYPLLERLSPRTRKIELFARPHNAHAGWMSLGNQLDGVRIVDEGLRQRFRSSYPGVEIQPADPPASELPSPMLSERKERPGSSVDGVSGSIGSSAGLAAKNAAVVDEKSMQST
jgi:mRNA (2'-O-methyladenosine-N6-)-methyltransferase